jgi:hypothetical protein
MSQWLQLASGLLALAASGLVAFRVWTHVPVVKPREPPAVYAPLVTLPPEVRPGEVFETESPANGFILVVESTPDGVEVVIDGVSKGQTPASINFECAPPKTMELVLKHPGFAPITRTIACKRDVMLVLKVRPEPLRRR